MPHVVYDSDCDVCNAFRRWIAGRDRRAGLVFVGNATEEAKDLLPELSDERRRETLHWIANSGEHHEGAQAVLSTVASTGGVLGLASSVAARSPLHLLFEPGYRMFAMHRGRFARFFRE